MVIVENTQYVYVPPQPPQPKSPEKKPLIQIEEPKPPTPPSAPPIEVDVPMEPLAIESPVKEEEDFVEDIPSPPRVKSPILVEEKENVFLEPVRSIRELLQLREDRM